MAGDWLVDLSARTVRHRTLPMRFSAAPDPGEPGSWDLELERPEDMPAHLWPEAARLALEAGLAWRAAIRAARNPGRGDNDV